MATFEMQAKIINTLNMVVKAIIMHEVHATSWVNTDLLLRYFHAHMHCIMHICMHAYRYIHICIRDLQRKYVRRITVAFITCECVVPIHCSSSSQKHNSIITCCLCNLKYLQLSSLHFIQTLARDNMSV
jgi:hypothetical protein